MKHLEDTPWWICDVEDTNYCAYVDTDSNYFHAEPLLRHRFPNFDEMSDIEKDTELERIALEYQDIITDHYDNVAKDVFNINQFEWFDKPHWLEMKTECVIRSAYFRATRRYAQWITKQEGVVNETLDIKGLEFQKSNFPPLLGKFFNDVLVDVLKGETQDDIDSRVKVFKKQVLDGTIPLTDLGNPTSVKQINKHQGKPARVGEMLSTFNHVENKVGRKLGAPAAVKAAIRYNDLLRFWKLDKKHELITNGTKVKWIYLKPNPYHIEVMGYNGYNDPPAVTELIDKYIDRDGLFDSIIRNKLEGVYDDIGWSLNLNKYKEKFFNFI